VKGTERGREEEAINSQLYAKIKLRTAGRRRGTTAPPRERTGKPENLKKGKHQRTAKKPSKKEALK